MADQLSKGGPLVVEVVADRYIRCRLEALGARDGKGRCFDWSDCLDSREHVRRLGSRGRNWERWPKGHPFVPGYAGCPRTGPMLAVAESYVRVERLRTSTNAGFRVRRCAPAVSPDQSLDRPNHRGAWRVIRVIGSGNFLGNNSGRTSPRGRVGPPPTTTPSRRRVAVSEDCLGVREV